MDGSNSFLGDPANTREAIMRATFFALCEHGYADLTIQRIGDHFDKSKSLLYHHYDSKDDLLLDFLSFTLDRFQASVPDADADGPEARLETVFDRILAEDVDDDQIGFLEAMTELRAQAAHDDEFRDLFTEHDGLLVDRLSDIVADGVDSGAFRDDVDPDRAAVFLVTTLLGSMTRRTTTTTSDVAAVRAELDTYVERRLRADPADD
ncbi:TetR/AcrR family transcriptional regulator [Halobaculum sp. P14]|uniref:TetR/AcrR family transcriptional regulator n=1 Tax=Halobaculum sp. P14 TaxID=3421638 RepID=UPI003EBD1196